jgi:uncharacterized protein (TIGR02246 family)
MENQRGQGARLVDDDDDDRAVRRVIETYGERLKSSDLEGVLDLFAPDGVLLEPDRPDVIGTAQLRTAYDNALSTRRPDRSFHFDQVLIEGSLASVRTHSTGTITDRTTGEVVSAEAREIFVLTLLGGEWKIAQYMIQRMPAK